MCVRSTPVIIQAPTDAWDTSRETPRWLPGPMLSRMRREGRAVLTASLCVCEEPCVPSAGLGVSVHKSLSKVGLVQAPP